MSWNFVDPTMEPFIATQSSAIPSDKNCKKSKSLKAFSFEVPNFAGFAAAVFVSTIFISSSQVNTCNSDRPSSNNIQYPNVAPPQTIQSLAVINEEILVEYEEAFRILAR